ncbi:MAG TPA: exonuclease sbcCD subunit D, partial [Ruminococcaceae bacterium]|nr:exonuclease sbcCD subunit D [Oscillospiraceae bacterium]
MRFLHLSDLHIGKRVNEYSMTEDQRFILRQILGLAEDTRPDAVLIAGDLYDRSVPPGEAVGLLDDFLTELCARGVPVFAVSGNHDSPERLEFGSRIMRKNGVVLAGAFRGRPD